MYSMLSRAGDFNGFVLFCVAFERVGVVCHVAVCCSDMKASVKTAVSAAVFLCVLAVFRDFDGHSAAVAAAAKSR